MKNLMTDYMNGCVFTRISINTLKDITYSNCRFEFCDIHFDLNSETIFNRCHFNDCIIYSISDEEMSFNHCFINNCEIMRFSQKQTGDTIYSNCVFKVPLFEAIQKILPTTDSEKISEIDRIRKFENENPLASVLTGRAFDVFEKCRETETNSTLGAIFELYCRKILEKKYPTHTIYSYESGNEIPKDVAEKIGQRFDRDVGIDFFLIPNIDDNIYLVQVKYRGRGTISLSSLGTFFIQCYSAEISSTKWNVIPIIMTSASLFSPELEEFLGRKSSEKIIVYRQEELKYYEKKYKINQLRVVSEYLGI